MAGRPLELRIDSSSGVFIAVEIRALISAASACAPANARSSSAIAIGVAVSGDFHPLGADHLHGLGVVRKWISARAPATSFAAVEIPAENTDTVRMSGGSGPTTSTPGTAISSDICWMPISTSLRTRKLPTRPAGPPGPKTAFAFIASAMPSSSKIAEVGAAVAAADELATPTISPRASSPGIPPGTKCQALARPSLSPAPCRIADVGADAGDEPALLDQILLA